MGFVLRAYFRGLNDLKSKVRPFLGTPCRKALNDLKDKLTEVSIGYGGVDSSVNSGHRGSSVSNGLGSHGGGVAWTQICVIITFILYLPLSPPFPPKKNYKKLTISIGSSVASRETSIAIASISGRDNCGGGRGQTSENSDLQ